MGLFKPKWAKRNTEAAARFIRQTDDMQQIIQAAWEAPADLVRKEAVGRIDNQNILKELAEKSLSHEVRLEAICRIWNTNALKEILYRLYESDLFGKNEQILCIAALRNIRGPLLLMHALTDAPEELQLGDFVSMHIMSNMGNSDEMLRCIAENAKSHSIRLAAIGALPDVKEQIERRRELFYLTEDEEIREKIRTGNPRIPRLSENP